MAEVVLFPSVLGLRPGVLEAAEALGQAGHRVHTPDLYRGDAVFNDYEEAISYAQRIGQAELFARAAADVDDLPAVQAYVGFSAGAACAEALAGTRPGAQAAILLHGSLSPDRLGIAAWPPSVPVQVHYAEGDPFRDQAEVEALAGAVQAAGATYERHDYPGTAHLFADPGLPEEYDPASAGLMWERVDEFLRRHIS